nr:CPCC family cysteine-rich protein [Exiguobacterium sp. s36]
MKIYTCICCGYKTMEKKPPGTFAICPNCFWEDEGVNPDCWGGANGISLRTAQRNVIRFGVSDECYVNEYSTKEYQKDVMWKPIWETENSQSSLILIDGNVFCKKKNKNIDINRFNEQFEKMLKQNGWTFGGEFVQSEE